MKLLPQNNKNIILGREVVTIYSGTFRTDKNGQGFLYFIFQMWGVCFCWETVDVYMY